MRIFGCPLYVHIKPYAESRLFLNYSRTVPYKKKPICPRVPPATQWADRHQTRQRGRYPLAISLCRVSPAGTKGRAGAGFCCASSSTSLHSPPRLSLGRGEAHTRQENTANYLAELHIITALPSSSLLALGCVRTRRASQKPTDPLRVPYNRRQSPGNLPGRGAYAPTWQEFPVSHHYIHILPSLQQHIQQHIGRS